MTATLVGHGIIPAVNLSVAATRFVDSNQALAVDKGSCRKLARQYTLRDSALYRTSRLAQRGSRRSLRALPTTESELKLIAAAAIMGLNRTPKNG